MLDVSAVLAAIQNAASLDEIRDIVSGLSVDISGRDPSVQLSFIAAATVMLMVGRSRGIS